MNRVKGWEKRLRETFAGWRGRKLVWGQSDCACLAADAAMAVTGCVDPIASWRGQYDSAESAMRLLRRRGFASLGDAVSAAGFPEINIHAAHRGDLGALDDAIGGLCVIDGPVLVAIGEDDLCLIALPRARLKRAFRVGDDR